MKLSYYPGCSIHATSKEYEQSAEKILNKLGFELEEIKDWNCCGAVEAQAMNHFLSVALPARTFTIPLPDNSNQIIMLCNACFQSHAKSLDELKRNSNIKQKIEEILGRKINTDIKLYHLLYFIINNIEKTKFKENIKISLSNIKIMPYYGCSIVRPSSILQGDDPNFPHTMEDLIILLGGVPVSSKISTKCCGGTAMLTEENVSLNLNKNIIEEARKTKADCISVVCPLCDMALENTSLKLNSEIPVVYFTQLIGLSFGFKPEELGLNKNLISTEKLLKKINEMVIANAKQ